MTENSPIKSSSFTTEAPASWNTRYVTPDGFVCQITLRGDTGRDLLEKANAALAWLRDNGYYPCEQVSYRAHSNGAKAQGDTSTNNGTEANSNPSSNGNAHSAGFCLIHQCEMKRWEKDGKVWYSHKTEDGKWCTGKSK